MDIRSKLYVIHFNEIPKIYKNIKHFFLVAIFVTSCSSVDHHNLGQYNYLSCQNIAKASQDIFKKYPSLGKGQIKSSAMFFKNIGDDDSVEIITAKKDLERLSYSSEQKGCPKISL